MKSQLLKVIGGTFIAFLVFATATSVTIFGQDAQRDGAEEPKTEDAQGRPSHFARLVGVWDTQVSLRVCQTGAVIRTFPSLGTFHADGTMMDSTSGIPQGAKTPGQGVWTATDDVNFIFRFKSFSFDAAGNPTGWTVITHYGRLRYGLDQYSSSGNAQVFDMNGNLLFTGCSSTTATRFQ